MVSVNTLAVSVVWVAVIFDWPASAGAAYLMIARPSLSVNTGVEGINEPSPSSEKVTVFPIEGDASKKGTDEYDQFGEYDADARPLIGSQPEELSVHGPWGHAGSTDQR